jgi:rfaE bifunctional protein kinase chain/domain
MTTQEILARFPRCSALVVGDICLDRWCSYDPALTEPSRETGIPRLAVVKTEVTPGAGGTVANNLAALGMKRIAVLGAIGTDGHGYELSSALNQRGIETDLLVRSSSVPTFTYTKLINCVTGEEDQSRVDFVFGNALPDDVEAGVLEHLRTFAESFRVIFVADQAETQRGGVVTANVRQALCEMAKGNPSKIIWVDSRVRSELFRHVILKPNQREVAEACTSLFGEMDYQRFRKHLEAKLMFVTLGSRGAMVVDDSGETIVPTREVDQPVDVCGAGDSFSAGAAVALEITGSPTEAARFGNLVTSVTIMKKGTGTASPEEILEADAHSRC